jgi:hypothetical protein
MYAANADLVPPVQVADVATCAQRCLNDTACVSFNLCNNSQSTWDCGISVRSRFVSVFPWQGLPLFLQPCARGHWLLSPRF